jgi:outer membrane autotransporter protein
VAGYHNKSYGLATGYDYGWSSGWLLGLGAAYHYTDFSWNRRRGHGHIQSGILCLYTGWCRKYFDIEFSILGEMNFYDMSRTINFPKVARTATSFHKGEGYTAHLGSGVEWYMGSFGMRPFISVDYSFLHQRKYKEYGAQSLNLNVDKKNTRTLRAEAGIDFTGICSWQRKGWVQPTFHASWVGEIPLSNANYRAALRGQGNSGCGDFTVRSFHKMRNRFSPGASVTLAPYDTFAVTFYYAAEIGGQFLGQKADVRIERKF